jgi:hypothetical protein
MRRKGRELEALHLLWHHSFAGDAVAPEKVQADAHTPKNHPKAPSIGSPSVLFLDR